MFDDLDDPRCPECGGPIGPTATYCIHCSADLDGREPVGPGDSPAVRTASGRGGPEEPPLDPEGFVDDSLTVVVGIVGGIVVGVVGTLFLLFATGSGWALAFGLVAWLVATAYLVRRRSVLDAVSKAGYGVALVLLVVPLATLSPAVSMEGGLLERGGAFVALLVLVAVPAGVAAAVGWFASRYVPADGSGREA